MQNDATGRTGRTDVQYVRDREEVGYRDASKANQKKIKMKK